MLFNIIVRTPEELKSTYERLDNGNRMNWLCDRFGYVFSHEWEGIGEDAGPKESTFINYLPLPLA